MYRCIILVSTIGVATLIQDRRYFETGTCEQRVYGYVPTAIYDDLRCTPIHDASIEENCPVKFDCSHIYNRPKGTCHFKGKSIKIGDLIDNEELVGVGDSECSCTKDLQFECPELTDGCVEDWVGGYPKPRCYLRYELNSYCASGEVCPPFDGKAECKVKGVTYREGDKFGHPYDKCVQCVCDKGFDGKFEAPFCQPINCTTELRHSKAIDDHCAPYYDYEEDYCCPQMWVCPSKDGTFASNPLGTPRDQPISEFSCKFGDRTMGIGDYYKDRDVYCQCDIPPFVTCEALPKPVILDK